MNLIGVKARNALKIKIDTKIKNKVLNDYALLLDKEKKDILIQNKKDVNLAKKNKIKENLINRLSINPIKLKGIQVSIKKNCKIKRSCQCDFRKMEKT